MILFSVVSLAEIKLYAEKHKKNSALPNLQFSVKFSRCLAKDHQQCLALGRQDPKSSSNWSLLVGYLANNIFVDMLSTFFLDLYCTNPSGLIYDSITLLTYELSYQDHTVVTV